MSPVFSMSSLPAAAAEQHAIHGDARHSTTAHFLKPSWFCPRARLAFPDQENYRWLQGKLPGASDFFCQVVVGAGQGAPETERLLLKWSSKQNNQAPFVSSIRNRTKSPAFSVVIKKRMVLTPDTVWMSG